MKLLRQTVITLVLVVLLLAAGAALTEDTLELLGGTEAVLKALAVVGVVAVSLTLWLWTGQRKPTVR